MFSVQQVAVMPYSAKAIANYFIDLAERDRNELTPMKLQKLVYIAHGWHLAITGNPLIDEQVEAWPYGPVVPSLYHEFKVFGNMPIDQYAYEFNGYDLREVPPPNAEDEFTQELLHKIWEVYGRFSAVQLSNMTHQPGTPWYEIWRPSLPKGTDIPQEVIKQHFEQLAEQSGNG